MKFKDKKSISDIPTSRLKNMTIHQIDDITDYKSIESLRAALHRLNIDYIKTSNKTGPKGIDWSDIDFEQSTVAEIMIIKDCAYETVIRYAYKKGIKLKRRHD